METFKFAVALNIFFRMIWSSLQSLTFDLILRECPGRLASTCTAPRWPCTCMPFTIKFKKSLLLRWIFVIEWHKLSMSNIWNVNISGKRWRKNAPYDPAVELLLFILNSLSASRLADNHKIPWGSEFDSMTPNDDRRCFPKSCSIFHISGENVKQKKVTAIWDYSVISKLFYGLW